MTVDRQGREVVKMRAADTEGLPPGRCRITSSYDPDALGRQTRPGLEGYKLQISETCDAGDNAGDVAGSPPPNLITNVATTDASVPDVAMTELIHEDLAGRDVLPAEHYLDSGYPSANLLISSLARFGVARVTPMLADTSPQARAGDGFDRTAFTVDWDNQQVTCPQGQFSASWTPADQRGIDVIVVKVPGEACQSCPVKAQCTTASRAAAS